MQSIANKKYREILNRSFKKTLDIFLLKLIVEHCDYEKVKQQITTASFRAFLEKMNTDNSFHKRYTDLDRKSHQCRKDDEIFQGIKVSIIDLIFKKWLAENQIQPYKEIYRSTFLEQDTFVKFYGDNSDERRCHYCNISEDEITLLITNDEIKTKRLSRRGKLMEIDRILPNSEYKEGNMVLSCYWCNNAKTDEFTYEEFRKIGDEIRTIWQGRLSVISKQ